MKRKALFWGIMALLLPWASLVSAGSLDTFGASSRGTAMGGAMVGIAEGWEATYYNPSALGLSRDSTAVEVSTFSGGMVINDIPSFGGGFGAKFGVSHRFLRDRLGVGLTVGVPPGGSGLSLDPTALLGGGGGSEWGLYKDQLPVLLGVGVGLRITDWLSVGVATSPKQNLISMGYYPLVIDPILESLIGIRTGVIPSNIQSTSFSMGSYDGTDVAVAYNVTLRPSKYLSLGYVYRPETTTRLKLRLELVGGEGSLLPESQFMLFDITMPSGPETTIYGGAGHIPLPWNDGLLTLAYQHETQNWAGFYQQTIQYQWTPSDIFRPEWFSNAGGDPPLLEDVAFDRYGFEYDGSANPLLFWKLKNLSNARFAVRGGYYHWNSPQQQPRYTYQLAMIDSDADVYSFGLGFSYDRKRKVRIDGVPPRISIDLHYQRIDLEDRNYQFRPDDFGNVPLSGNYLETGGSVTQLGAQITWWQ